MENLGVTMYEVFAITGIVGSIICAAGDYFLYRCQGTDSVRIGEAKKLMIQGYGLDEAIE